MAGIWITYCWADNDDGDVDFVVQELRNAGLDVRVDRFQLGAGKPLWDQIEKEIGDRSKLNAWVMYTTVASLKSQPCREELAGALNRALSDGRDAFPLIGLIPVPLDFALLPQALSTRLCVNLADPDWIERIVSAAEGRGPSVAPKQIAPYGFKIHAVPGYAMAVEVWPRSGRWQPFVHAVPHAEAPAVGSHVVMGKRGKVPSNLSVVAFNTTQFERLAYDGTEWDGCVQGSPEATPDQSAFVFCRTVPTRLLFGEERGHVYIADVR